MTIEQQIKYLDEQCPFCTHHTSKRLTRHNFFNEINTEIQAYLFGFYAADGSIDERRKTFRVHLSEVDKEIIYLYRDFICPNARIFSLKEGLDKNPRNKSKYIVRRPTIGIDINSTIISNALVNLGFGYRKTYSENRLPKINPELIRHFIRGYFDGDGTITGSYVKPDPKWKKNENFRSYASIIAHSKTIIYDIQEWLKQNDIHSTVCQDSRDKLYIISIPKLQLPKLFKLLYEDSHFYMKRKYEKFNYYVNTEISQLIADHRKA